MRTMTRITTVVLTASLLLTFYNCRQKPDSEAVLSFPMPGTAPVDSASAQSSSPSVTHSLPIGPGALPDYIEYDGTADDSIKYKLATLPSLLEACLIARRYVRLRDSIWYKHENFKIGDPKRSLDSAEMKAYRAFMTDKKKAETGLVIPEKCPNLLQLNRTVAAGDVTHAILPDVQPSSLLADGSFFFLGGSPFLENIYPEDNAVFTDPSGHPERRFACVLNENVNYALTSLLHFKKVPVRIALAPELTPYDDELSERNVKGIGSIIHEFINSIPVSFITEQGIVTARLTNLKTNTFPGRVGCYSGQPRLQFACSKNLDAHEILAVYIP
jgi:hypothetical protein